MEKRDPVEEAKILIGAIKNSLENGEQLVGDYETIIKKERNKIIRNEMLKKEEKRQSLAFSVALREVKRFCREKRSGVRI